MVVVTRQMRTTEDELLVAELNTTDDVSQFADLTKITQLLRYSISLQTDIREDVKKNTVDIKELQQENEKMQERVDRLEEANTRLDQYSRKDVMVVTGVPMETGETSEQLFTHITGIFNKISSANRVISKDDFIAIHRNSSEYRGNRPPTITVKFIRFFDKESFFNKDVKQKLVRLYPGVKFHHNLCRGLIMEQNLIKQHDKVKFVIYQGARRNFSVCLNNDKFINKVRNFNDFLNKINKL